MTSMRHREVIQATRCVVDESWGYLPRIASTRSKSLCFSTRTSARQSQQYQDASTEETWPSTAVSLPRYDFRALVVSAPAELSPRCASARPLPTSERRQQPGAMHCIERTQLSWALLEELSRRQPRRGQTSEYARGVAAAKRTRCHWHSEIVVIYRGLSTTARRFDGR